MHLVLVVPRLATLASVAEPAAPAPPRMPGFARLLAAAGAPTRDNDGLAAALAARYGIARQTDWPIAPIRLAALGVDPGASYWLAADPVTIVAGRDDTHVGAAIRDFTAAESDALIATLNAHFAGDGLRFIAPRPDAWFVCAPNVPAMSTRPLDTAQGKSLRTQLPVGADAKAWWRWQEEIQMLLFTHPVTAARERTGRQSANAVWFAAGGTRPPRSGTGPMIATFAGDDLAGALAAHVGTLARPLPAHLDAVLAQSEGAQTVILAPGAPIDFEAIDRAFATPAADALEHGSIADVTVLADAGGGAFSWRAQRPPWSARIARRFRRPDITSLLVAATREGA